MMKIVNIGKQILKGCLRSRSLSLVVFFTLTLFLFISMLSGSDNAYKPKLIIDSGLSLISLFGFVLVAFIVLPVFSNEKERRTLSATLSFPVTRTQIIWGILLGSLAAMAINYVAMSLIFLVTLLVMKVSITVAIFRQLFLSLLGLSVLTSFAILFSVLFGYVVAAMTTAGFFILGNLTITLQQALESYDGSSMYVFLKFITNIIPSFSLFDLKDIILKNTAIPYYYELIALIYAISLIVIAIEITLWKFSKETIL